MKRGAPDRPSASVQPVSGAPAVAGDDREVEEEHRDALVGSSGYDAILRLRKDRHQRRSKARSGFGAGSVAGAVGPRPVRGRRDRPMASRLHLPHSVLAIMKVVRVADCVWEIPPSAKPGMLVPARLYASETLLSQMDQGVFEQVTNVACLVRAASKAGVAEEAGFAYKDLREVVDVVHRLDISRRVVSLTPIGNIKG